MGAGAGSGGGSGGGYGGASVGRGIDGASQSGIGAVAGPVGGIAGGGGGQNIGGVSHNYGGSFTGQPSGVSLADLFEVIPPEIEPTVVPTVAPTSVPLPQAKPTNVGPSSEIGALVAMGIDPGLAAALVGTSTGVGTGVSSPSSVGQSPYGDYGGPAGPSNAPVGQVGGVSGGAASPKGDFGGGSQSFGGGFSTQGMTSASNPVGVLGASPKGDFGAGFPSPKGDFQGSSPFGGGINSVGNADMPSAGGLFGGTGSAFGSSFGGGGYTGPGSVASSTGNADHGFGVPGMGSVGPGPQGGFGPGSFGGAVTGGKPGGLNGGDVSVSPAGGAPAGWGGYAGPQAMPSDFGFAVAQVGQPMASAMQDAATKAGHSIFGWGPDPKVADDPSTPHSTRQASLALGMLNSMAPNAGITAAMNNLGPQGLMGLLAAEGVSEGVDGMAGVFASIANRALAQEAGFSNNLGNPSNIGTMFSALNDPSNTVSAQPGTPNAKQAALAAILGTQQDIVGLPSKAQTASHYFAQNTVTPNWADDSFTQFGNHTFGNTAPAPSAAEMADIRAKAYGDLESQFGNVAPSFGTPPQSTSSPSQTIDGFTISPTSGPPPSTPSSPLAGWDNTIDGLVQGWGKLNDYFDGSAARHGFQQSRIGSGQGGGPDIGPLPTASNAGLLAQLLQQSGSGMGGSGDWAHDAIAKYRGL